VFPALGDLCDDEMLFALARTHPSPNLVLEPTKKPGFTQYLTDTLGRESVDEVTEQAFIL
jgi:hypothetical protein